MIASINVSILFPCSIVQPLLIVLTGPDSQVLGTVQRWRCGAEQPSQAFVCVVDRQHRLQTMRLAIAYQLGRYDTNRQD